MIMQPAVNGAYRRSVIKASGRWANRLIGYADFRRPWARANGFLCVHWAVGRGREQRLFIQCLSADLMGGNPPAFPFCPPLKVHLSAPTACFQITL